MKRILALIAAVFLSVGSAHAQLQAINGACTYGGQNVITSGLMSTTLVAASYPLCTVSVYFTGTTTLATIYTNGSSAPLSNPFTGTSSGSWLFYATPGVGYDIVMSGGTPNSFPSPSTLTDVFAGGTGGGGGGGSGTVLSVGLQAPSIFTVAGSPITTAGTLYLALNTQTANTVFAGPSSGSSAVPSFRSLTALDVQYAGLLSNSTTGNAGTASSSPAVTLTGTTLAPNVLYSSLTSVATITSGTWNGSLISPQFGGTGLNTSGLTGCPSIASGVWSVATCVGNTSPFQSLTTTGTSGVATLVSGVLNIPNYTNSASGTVTSVSVATSNGVSGTVSNPTTTPAITLSLGAINPSSVGASTQGPGYFTSLTATSLTTGDCMQAGTSGLLGTVSSPCPLLNGTNSWTGASAVATGGSWTYSGSGTINASSLGGIAATEYCQISGTNCPASSGVITAITPEDGITSELSGTTAILGLGVIMPTGVASSGAILQSGGGGNYTVANSFNVFQASGSTFFDAIGANTSTLGNFIFRGVTLNSAGGYDTLAQLNSVGLTVNGNLVSAISSTGLGGTVSLQNGSAQGDLYQVGSASPVTTWPAYSMAIESSATGNVTYQGPLILDAYGASNKIYLQANRATIASFASGGITVTGGMQLTQSGTGEVQVINGVAPNISIGGSASFAVGDNISLNDMAELVYVNNAGSGSAANTACFGLQGSTNACINGVGNLYTPSLGATLNTNISAQGAYLEWDLIGGQGETEFVNLRGGGPGGFNWWNGSTATTGSTTGLTQLMALNSSGALGWGGGATISSSASVCQSNGTNCPGYPGTAPFGAQTIPAGVCVVAYTGYPPAPYGNFGFFLMPNTLMSSLGTNTGSLIASTYFGSGGPGVQLCNTSQTTSAVIPSPGFNAAVLFVSPY